MSSHKKVILSFTDGHEKTVEYVGTIEFSDGFMHMRNLNRHDNHIGSWNCALIESYKIEPQNGY